MTIIMVSLLAVCMCVASLLASSCIGGGDKLNVHLIPHTHDDVGWLKNIDQYYYGANRTLQDGSVQYILDTVMVELAKNPDRKFIYVEIAFFYRWWNEQTDQMKDQVRSFVKNGQLEFINGGWCMNDEATAHYNAIIDQMTLGLKFIENNFGPDARPTVGWQIDPFGHSNEQASIFSRLGFNGNFFWRFDYNDKQIRLNESTMELIWRGSNSLKSPSADIFTSILYNGYGPPKGFCFDEKCHDEPIKDDPDLFDNNVDERVEAFTRAVFDQAKHYRTSNILIPMGSDFQYSDAVMWFKNIDKLIKYVNEKNSSVNLMYSTPSIYLDYVHKSDLIWTIKTDDFLPNADDPYDFWTGFYTSRPSLKGYVRTSNNVLQVCKQLEALSNPSAIEHPSSLRMKMAVAVAQHHDAVAGTERQHVADDYAKRLHIGEVECRQVISTSLNTQLNNGNGEKMDLKFCEYLNISACPSSESGNFNLVVYNPLGRPYHWYLRFPVNSKSVSVQGPDGKTLPIQVLPISNATIIVRNELSKAPYEAVLSLSSSPVPPLGYSVYTARTKKTADQTSVSCSLPKVTKFPLDDVVISNNFYEIEFSGSTGRLMKMTNLKSSISTMTDQQFLWYNSSTGNNINSTQASGAYVFRPNSSELFPVNFYRNKAEIIKVYQGDVVSVVEQRFSSWASQVVRLYKELPVIEFEFTIGPIPIKDGLGKEVISRFDTDLLSDSTFYTDSNGREMQKRIRNHRPTWKYNNTAPVAGNYYPVNSRIFIRDEKTKQRQFTVMTDRTQGGSSLEDGSIELMIHRRILHDDNRGVVEPLNETGQSGEGLTVRGRHVVIFDDYSSSTYLHRMIGEQMMLEPQLAFAESNLSYSDIVKTYNLVNGVLKKELPDNVHLLTLEYLEFNKFLLRLEHQFEATDPTHNNHVTVSLSDLFTPFVVHEVRELALGANVAQEDVKRYTWKTDSTKSRSSSEYYPVISPNYNVLLLPMDIRTFNITVSRITLTEQ